GRPWSNVLPWKVGWRFGGMRRDKAVKLTGAGAVSHWLVGSKVELHTRIGRTGLTSTATAITRPWTCNIVFGSKRSWSCREGVHKRVPGSLSRAKVTFLCRWQGRLGDRSVPQRLDGAKRALFGCPRIAPGLSQVPYSTNHSATRSLERESDQKRSSPLGDHAEERLVLFVSPSV